VRAPKRWPKKVKPSNAPDRHHPRGSLVQIEVDEIAAPGAWRIRRTAGHVPFMTALKPGVSSTDQGRPRFLAVATECCKWRTAGERQDLGAVESGRAARDIDRDNGRAGTGRLDAELAKTKAETPPKSRRCWKARLGAARVDAANRVK